MRWMSTVLVLGVSLAGCNPGEPSSGGTSTLSAGMNPTAVPAVAPVRSDRPAQNHVPSVATQRGRALGWLPADALFTLRISDLGGHPEAFRGTALAAALDQLDLSEQKAALQKAWALLHQKVTEEFPPGAGLLDTLRNLHGELVFSVVHLDPMQMMSRRTPGIPVTLALYVELGPNADAVRTFLGAAADMQGGDSTFRRLETDRYEGYSSGDRFDLWQKGDYLALAIGAEGSNQKLLDQWMSLAPQDSMLACDLVTSSPLHAESGTVWGEAYFSLDPLWKLARAMAPKDFQEIMTLMGLEELRGVSFAMGTQGTGFADHLLLQTTGQKNLISRMLAGAPVDPSFARFAPLSSSNVGVLALEPGRVLHEIRSSLGGAERAALQQALQTGGTMTGVNLEKDLLQQWGPNFLVATKGDFLPVQGKSNLELLLAIQVKDPRATQGLLSMGLAASGMAAKVKTESFRNHTLQTLSIPFPPEVPFRAEPSWVFVDGALLVATSPALLKESLATAEAGGARAAGWTRSFAQAPEGALWLTYQSTAAQLRSVTEAVFPAMHLAGQQLLQETGEKDEFQQLVSDVFAMPWPTSEQIVKAAKDLPDSTGWGRVTPDGIEMRSSSPLFGSVGVSGLASVAVVASIAIPNLLSARLAANEAAAISTLRSVASAEAQFRHAFGQHGTLGQLTGHEPVAGGDLLNPPMLSPRMVLQENGVLDRSGYYFRLFLPADGQARHFLLYAWPKQSGQSGNRVFMISDEGTLFHTSNNGDEQHYSGEAHPPAALAAMPETSTSDYPTYRVGKDGGVWSPVD